MRTQIEFDQKSVESDLAEFFEYLLVIRVAKNRPTATVFEAMVLPPDIDYSVLNELMLFGCESHRTDFVRCWSLTSPYFHMAFARGALAYCLSRWWTVDIHHDSLLEFLNEKKESIFEGELLAAAGLWQVWVEDISTATRIVAPDYCLVRTTVYPNDATADCLFQLSNVDSTIRSLRPELLVDLRRALWENIVDADVSSVYQRLSYRALLRVFGDVIADSNVLTEPLSQSEFLRASILRPGSE
ncbi:MAG: hypothetical protein ABI557_14355 [Aureliella sp.]